MFHRHRWVARATQRLEVRNYNWRGRQIGEPEPVTEVLQTCDKAGCYDIRTIELAGVWTLDQVRVA